MRSADAARRVPWLRYALLAVALSAVWLVISLFSSAPSASADDRDHGSGLLGTAGSLLGGVTDVTGAAGDVVGGGVVGVVATVTAPVDAVVELLPEPAAEPVAEIVPAASDTVTGAAGTAISGVDATVGTAVNGVAVTVSGLVEGGAVSGIARPVAGIVDGIVHRLPIVGALLPVGTVGGLLGPVAGTVDESLCAIIGTAPALPTDGTGILPQRPGIPLLPSGPGGSEPGGVTAGLASGAPPGWAGLGLDSLQAAHAGPPGPAGTLASGGGDTSPTAGPLALGTPVGGSGAGSGTGASGSGSASASGTSDAAFAALELDALASLALHSVDDELPSSPVYDTDSTPD
ncbi:hypothetical protein [Agromyces badenianii]|uniref:hypothetical protein n=1 Tax=Agromyces badenianii TaxID=2080742 RepID=UPI001059B30A|nr:hypothetical protein [Agromyces badenianii]